MMGCATADLVIAATLCRASQGRSVTPADIAGVTPEDAMDAQEIVIEEMQRQRMGVVLGLLGAVFSSVIGRECIRIFKLLRSA
jgi:hypothetical protein